MVVDYTTLVVAKKDYQKLKTGIIIQTEMSDTMSDGKFTAKLNSL